MTDSQAPAVVEPTPPTPSALAEASDVLAGLHALRQTLAPTLTDAELELFALIAKRKGLDPFSGQIVAVKRNTNRGARVSYQTGIDGYRSLAERTGEYLGSDLPEFGPACECGKAPAYHPEWASIVVHRLHPSGRIVDQPARSKWHEFVPSDAGFMWAEKPEVMLAKCTEAQALRKAFPWVLGDLYIPEEMGRADEADGGSTGPARSAREAVAAKAAAIRGEPPATEAEPGEAKAPAAEAENGSGELARGTGELAVDPVLSTAPEAMSASAFGEAVKALGIPRARVVERATQLFGEKPAADLSPDQWGELYADLRGGAA